MCPYSALGRESGFGEFRQTVWEGNLDDLPEVCHQLRNAHKVGGSCPEFPNNAEIVIIREG